MGLLTILSTSEVRLSERTLELSKSRWWPRLREVYTSGDEMFSDPWFEERSKKSGDEAFSGCSWLWEFRFRCEPSGWGVSPLDGLTGDEDISDKGVDN